MFKIRLLVLFLVLVIGLSFVCEVESASVSDELKEGLNTSSHIRGFANYSYLDYHKEMERERIEKGEYIGSYEFVEPPDMARRLSDYRQIDAICPTPITAENIRSKIDMLVTHGNIFDYNKIIEMIKECEDRGRFTILPIDPEPELDECLTHLLIVLKNVNLSNYNEKDLFIECLKRLYFTDQVSQGVLPEFNENNISISLEERDNAIINKFSEGKQMNRPRCENEECIKSNETLDLPEGYVCEANYFDCKEELVRLKLESTNESNFIELLDASSKIQKIKEKPQVEKNVDNAFSRFSKLLDILKNLFGFR